MFILNIVVVMSMAAFWAFSVSASTQWLWPMLQQGKISLLMFFLAIIVINLPSAGFTSLMIQFIATHAFTDRPEDNQIHNGARTQR